MKRICRFMLALTLAVAGSVAFAADAAREQHFAVSGHGDLVLALPSGWDAQANPSPDDASTSIVIRPGTGTMFDFAIGATAPPSKDVALPTPSELRALVQASADHIKDQSVEPEISIVEFPGTSGPGYYYSATDNAPKPGEYNFLTQGALRVGGLVVTFTVLTGDGQTAVVDQALSVVKAARQDGG